MRGIDMIFGLLISLYTFLCIFLVLIILLQKGKSSLGMGGLGGGTQMLFGGSGGQDLFQKITWGMGALFLAGSLALALMKSHLVQKSRYLSQISVPSQATPQAPAATPPVTQNEPKQSQQ
jgi:preprotein translocase subunit SecG